MVLESAAKPTGTVDRDRLVAFVAIESLNAWAEFSRAYFLSLLLDPVRRDGAVVTTANPAIASQEDAIRGLWMVLNPGRTAPGSFKRRDEPRWHEARVLPLAASLLRATNDADVSGAINLAAQTLQDFPVLRNFYAHRNGGTAISVKNLVPRYGTFDVEHPTEFAMTYLPGATDTILASWIGDLEAVASLVC